MILFYQLLDRFFKFFILGPELCIGCQQIGSNIRPYCFHQISLADNVNNYRQYKQADKKPKALCFT